MMHSKFIFVSLLCLTAVFVQLPSTSSDSTPRTEQIPAAAGQKFVWPGCHEEKKQIDQLVGTIDALKQQIPAKNTISDMEHALRREKAKNQELRNAISEHGTKNLHKKVLEISLREELLEQQNKNLEERIVFLDNNVKKLLRIFTDCKENREVLVQKVTNQLQSCETERKKEKKIADQSTLNIEAVKRHLNNCTVEKDSLEVKKGNSVRDKTALIANLELCEEKRKMFNNYVLDSFLRNSYFYEVEKYTRYAVARLGMLPIKNAKPLIPEFGPVINDVLSFRYPINIPSCQAAEITNTLANPSVFIAIISAPGNFRKRNDIRETWLIHLKNALEKNLLGISTRFGFFLGKTQDDSIQKRIEEESQRHGDIVQIEMDDSYRNLTLKGIAVLNWVRQHCVKLDLVFKVDDDVYVNVHNLVHFVRSNYQSNNSVFGYPLLQTVPVRDKDSKHYISIEEYPWVNYPYYVQGPAYFMHASVVIPLLAASQTIPFNPFEDVFLTGMCREKAGAKIQISAGQSRFLFYIITSIPKIRTIQFSCTVPNIHYLLFFQVSLMSICQPF
jgi:hypothetical protein